MKIRKRTSNRTRKNGSRCVSNSKRKTSQRICAIQVSEWQQRKFLIRILRSLTNAGIFIKNLLLPTFWYCTNDKPHGMGNLFPIDFGSNAIDQRFNTSVLWNNTYGAVNVGTMNEREKCDSCSGWAKCRDYIGYCHEMRALELCNWVLRFALATKTNCIEGAFIRRLRRVQRASAPMINIGNTQKNKTNHGLFYFFV